MMSTSQELAEGNVRVALGDVFIDEWNATGAGGYDPELPESDSKHLDIHLGEYDEDKPFPQLVLRSVSESESDVAWMPDGSGVVEKYTGRIDVQVYTGSSDDVPENPELLAEAIARHARDIVQDNYNGITDPNTGGSSPLVESLTPLTRPVALPDTDQPETRYFAVLEVGYVLAEEPH